MGREERACLALADVAAEVAGLASPLHLKTIEDSQESVGVIEAREEMKEVVEEAREETGQGQSEH